MITAIRATSQTLVSLLSARLLAEPSLAALFGGGGGAVVSLSNPDEMVRLRATGVSVWLYRVARDDATLNRDAERTALGLSLPQPLPLRLFYMITPILAANAAQSPESEQHILGAVLQTFHDRPILSGADLAGDFTGSDVELALHLQSLGLEELTRIWDSLERAYQLCAAYEVSLVEIASARAGIGGTPVLTPEAPVGPGHPLGAP